MTDDITKVTLPSGETWNLRPGAEYDFDGEHFSRIVRIEQRPNELAGFYFGTEVLINRRLFKACAISNDYITLIACDAVDS